MACRPCRACKAALAETTDRFPNRSKASDGICASQKHSQQNPNSDHEPDQDGEATAYDLTHDPAHGVDCNAFVALLVARRDPRVKYVIWNRTIWRSYAKPGLPAWSPQKYTGSNPHTKHCHVSVLQSRKGDGGSWWRTPKQEDDVTPEEHDWLGRIHHEVAAGDKSAKTVTQMLQEVLDRLTAIEQAHGID